MIKKKLAALINVKTVISFVVIGVFAYLAITGRVDAAVAMTVVTMVVGFYFGTQKQKQDDADQNTQEG